MVSVISVLLALLGLFGSWPHFEKGIFAKLSSKVAPEWLKFAQSKVPELKYVDLFAFARIDGWILIIGALILFLTLFMITTKFLVNFRRVIVSLLWLFFTAELMYAITAGGVPIKYTMGLLYTVVMLTLALIFAFTNFGSRSSLLQSIQGNPTSDVQTLTKTVQTLFRDSRLGVKWTVESPQIGHHEIRENVLKIGRDSTWANVVIPNKYKYVSNKHLKISPHGLNNILVEALGKFSPKINGQLIKPNSTAVFDTDFLTIELVAGYPPNLTVKYKVEELPVVHPRTMKQGATIVANAYKNAKWQVRASVLSFMVALFFFAPMSFLNTMDIYSVYQTYKEKYQKMVEEVKKKEEEIALLNKKKKRLEAQKRKLAQKLKEYKQQSEVYQEEIEELKRQIDSLEMAAKSMEEEIVERERRISESLSQLLEYYIGNYIFGGVVIDDSGRGIGWGTFWLGEYNGQSYFITARHVIEGGREVCIIHNYVSRTEGNSKFFVPCNGEITPETCKCEFVDISKFKTFKDYDLAYAPAPTNEGIPIIKIRDTSNFRIAWIGFPELGEGLIISRADHGLCFDKTIFEGKVAYSCEAAANYGASGSPAFIIDQNLSGIKAIGVVMSMPLEKFDTYIAPFPPDFP